LKDSPEVADARSGLGEEDERFLLEQLLPAAPWLVSDEELPALAAKLTPAAIAERVVEIRDTLRHPTGMLSGQILKAIH